MLGKSDRTKLGVAIGLVGLLFAGCLKPDDFPKEPMITYKSLTQHGDSASFTIAFTDGDGDVGLNASDDQPPFDTASPYYHNLFLEYEELRNGVWTQVNFVLPLRYRIPRITPTGQNKALEGEIAVALQPWPYTTTYDTVRISAHMLDRSLNQSNTVVSEAITVVH